MKYLTIATFLLLTNLATANSCLTIQNGKKILCNNYAKAGAEYTTKQEKFCKKGDLNMAGMVIKNQFLAKKCDLTKAVAKCRRKGRDMTVYYNGEIADLEKGCKFFKSAELIKLQ